MLQYRPSSAYKAINPSLLSGDSNGEADVDFLVLGVADSAAVVAGVRVVGCEGWRRYWESDGAQGDCNDAYNLELWP